MHLLFVDDVRDFLNLLDPSLGSDAALSASRQGFPPCGQAAYVTTLPTPLVLTRPPLDTFVSL